MLLFLWCTCFLSYSSYGQTISAPPLSAEIMQDWYNLNHYDKEGKSDIRNPDFFISPSGQNNPLAEYEAFSDLLKKYQEGRKEHAGRLCDFPARLTFAEKYFKGFYHRNRPDCPAFEAAVKPNDVQSVSLIFANGYFNNPSSYYGHLLLRFNYDKDVLRQYHLDSSINYGADATHNSGSVMYVLNGLFGGYGASYQLNNDFINTHRYTNAQLRDIWDYRLNLTPVQRRFFVEHYWELRKAKFTYYFVNDNCAHRVADLINRATGLHLGQSHGIWLLPMQVIHAIENAENQNRPLVSRITYHPSLKSLFEKRYHVLTKSQKQALKKALSASPEMQEKSMPALTDEMLLMMLDHQDINKAQLSIEQKKQEHGFAIDRSRRVILSELYKRSVPKKQQDPLQGNYPVLSSGRKSSVIQTGIIQRKDEKFLTLHYRIANNDFLDQTLYGQEKSRFTMGSLEIETNGQNWLVRDVTAFDVTNLSTNALPADAVTDFSWQLKLAYQPRNNICNDCKTLSFTGKIGKSYQSENNFTLFSLWGMSLNHRKADSFSHLTMVGENGILADYGTSTRFLGGIDGYYNPWNDETDAVVKLHISHDLSTNSDIRLGAETNFAGDQSLSLRLGYYFD